MYNEYHTTTATEARHDQHDHPDAQADWPTIVDRFRTRFSDVAHRGATNHGTKGANFMTPTSSASSE